jgi:hypothetical protein
LDTEHLQIPGFYSFNAGASKGRRGRPFGGVTILVAPHIQGVRLIEARNNHVIVATADFYVIGAYYSPTFGDMAMIEDLSALISSIPLGIPIILAGDFNARIDISPHPIRTDLLVTCLHLNSMWLCSLPSPLTYVSPQGDSTVDLIASSLPVTSISTPELAVGHSIHLLRKHKPVRVSVTVQAAGPAAGLPSPRLSKWVSQQSLIEALRALCTDPEWPNMEISVAVRAIVKAIISATPLAPVSHRVAKPWFDKVCYEARAIVIQAKILFDMHQSMRRNYMHYKKLYKKTLKLKRREWQVREESRLLARAEEHPYVYGRVDKSRAVCPIAADTMRTHFRDIAGGISTAPAGPPPPPSGNLTPDQTYWNSRLSDPFTAEEVEAAIKILPHGKAEGPDRLRYEHLQGSPELASVLTSVFNRCLIEARFPKEWAECLMILIPKGKGNRSEPDAWRGISKKAVLGKLFASLLAKRLLRYLSNCGFLPQEQHGFLPGRSTISAMESLMEHLRANLVTGGAAVYAIFIDFRAAFNTASRTAIINTLSRYGVGGPFLELLNAMLAPNMVKLFDGLVQLPEFSQDTVLPQGDTISSLLFVVLLMGLPEYVGSRAIGTITQLYADDLLLLHRALRALQEATRATMEFAAERGLNINWSKTKIIKFRRGGPLAASDVFVIEEEVVPFVTNFCYLGITISVTAKTFTRHLLVRKTQAITAINLMKPPHALSLSAAMSLFHSNIAPMAYYGIQVIWEYLKVADFAILDSVMFVFLKRVLGVSQFSRSRLVLLLTRTTLLSERVARTFGLQLTPNFSSYLASMEHKLDSIDPAFLMTPAMRDRSWEAPLPRNRSAVCRHALHGFHHVFCATDGFHEPSSMCLCYLCGELCSTYHSSVCRASPYGSIAQLAAAN